MSPCGPGCDTLFGYAEQEPDDVARQLTVAAQFSANVVGRLSTDDWDLSVIYNYPRRVAVTRTRTTPADSTYLTRPLA
jgi:hypothetical protein